MKEGTTIESITVEEMVTQLSSAYASLIQKGISFRAFPSIMLWGPPGVGKSQGVRQIGTRIEGETGKKVKVTDVRLLLFNPVDLRGIPTANADKTLAVWLKPQIFKMDESNDVVNILLLDEISAAPQSVQAAAYQITLDRTIGEHKLPENCIVIAAGNRITDRSVTFNMPKALANRLCHLEIQPDIGSWLKWAAEANINNNVLSFLKDKPQFLMGFDALNDGLAFPTPRSWQMVSNLLSYISDDIGKMFAMVSGCVGTSAATALQIWMEDEEDIPSIRAIFNGTERRISHRAEAQYMAANQIVREANGIKTQAGINNAIAYLETMPTEFMHNAFLELSNIKEIRCFLANNDSYSWWALKNEIWLGDD